MGSAGIIASDDNSASARIRRAKACGRGRPASRLRPRPSWWESGPGPELKGSARRRVAAAAAAGIPSMSGHELRNRSHREIAIANPLDADLHGRPAPRRNPARLLLACPGGGSPPSLGRGRSQTGPGMPAAWLSIYGRRLYHPRRCMSVEKSRWLVTCSWLRAGVQRRLVGQRDRQAPGPSPGRTAPVAGPGCAVTRAPTDKLTTTASPATAARATRGPSWSLRAHGFQ
jgi:hypothetical protein